MGVAPGSKSVGVVRLVYENVNGLSAQLSNNYKLDKIKTIILDDLNADIFAFNRNQDSGTYLSQLPTPLSCVLSYLCEFLEKNQS
jgi:hypothetical protein